MTLSVSAGRSVTPVEHDERRAQSAVGDRRGVGDQAQHGGQERIEAEADHDGAADGDRRAAAGRPFEKGAEGEADQHRLDAGVAGQPGHRAAHDGELAGLDRDVVQQHGVEDGPADRQQAEGGAADEGHAGHVHRHAVDDDGDDDGGEGAGRPGLGRQPAPRHQQPEQHQHGQGRQQAWTRGATTERCLEEGRGAVGRPKSCGGSRCLRGDRADCRRERP